MHRFFVAPDCIQGETVIFSAEIARQMSRVLRLRPGQKVTALDNQGQAYEVVLDNLADKEACGRVTANRRAEEPNCRLSLFLCLSQREKFEWMLQKCTEIGAAAFTPVVSERTLVRDTGAVEKKFVRWRQILREAAEQSQRGRIPELHAPQTLAQALEQRPGFDLALMLWEGEQARTVRAALSEGRASAPGAPRAALLIGPEGGFSEAEVQQARLCGWQAVTLGPRILRMETAAVAASVIVLYEYD